MSNAENWLRRASTWSHFHIIQRSHAKPAPSTFTGNGHRDGLVHNDTYLKAASDAGSRYENEVQFYTCVEKARKEEPPDPIVCFVPQFHGVIALEGQDGHKERYMQLENLLREFDQPHTMDIKVGVRCFEEKELKVGKLRSDLYCRMKQMERRLPQPVLAEVEHEAKAISKARWMLLRDALSTTRSLGCRVDAIRTPHAHWTAFDSSLFCVRAEIQLQRVLRSFLPRAADCHAGVTPR